MQPYFCCCGRDIIGAVADLLTTDSVSFINFATPRLPGVFLSAIKL